MNDIYNKCYAHMYKAYALYYTGMLVTWDQFNVMPMCGAGARRIQAGCLSSIYKMMLSDPANGKRLKYLSRNLSKLNRLQRTFVKQWIRDFTFASRVKEGFLIRQAEVERKLQSAWKMASERKSFKCAEVPFQKYIDLKRKESEMLGYKGSPYDAVLEQCEAGLTTKCLDGICGVLKQDLRKLLFSITSEGSIVDGTLLKKKYSVTKQEELCKCLLKDMGVDIESIRLDRSTYPACCCISPGDIRISVRISRDSLRATLGDLLHEGGHALNGQGFSLNECCTPLIKSSSIGIQESQAILWECMIGRSREYCHYLLRKLNKQFPKQCGDIDIEAFYAEMNRVSPQLGGSSRDEVTSILHLIIRYELEKGMIEGSIKAREIPQIWSDSIYDVMHIAPSYDGEGIICDSQWQEGMFGYFPMYIMGYVYAAQIWESMKESIGDINRNIKRGKFYDIVDWLRKRYHCKKRLYSPGMLIRNATGKACSVQYLKRYLIGKYSDMYNLH